MNQQVARSPQKQLQDYFEKNKSQMLAALPKHLSPERMTRLAMTAFSQSRQLQQCDPKTIFSSIIVASQLGLEPGVMGQCYLVPYKNTCTLIPGWKGYVDLIARSGRAMVTPGAVFEGDEFDYELGTAQFIRHKPKGESDPLRLTHVYAIGEINGVNRQVVEVWPIDKVWKHRDKNNKVGRKHYSFIHAEMYAKKLPVLQVMKYLPMSTEMQKFQAVELAASRGKCTDYINGEFVTIDTEEPKQPPSIDQAASCQDPQIIAEIRGEINAMTAQSQAAIIANKIFDAPREIQGELNQLLNVKKESVKAQAK